jgi:thioredoxin
MPAAPSPIPLVSEATFEQEVLMSELPVLVDLYADWCAPCKVLEPRVVEVAQENRDKLKVVRVNVDQSPRIAQMFRAQSIPMLVLIVGGRPVGALNGAVPKHEIVDLVAPHLPGASEEVPAPELQKLLKARRVIALDVRESAPFARAHIPGAINIPAADVGMRATELAARRLPVVVYDRSGGDDAKGVVKTLEERGLPAVLLKGGFLGWEADGLDVDKAS